MSRERAGAGCAETDVFEVRLLLVQVLLRDQVGLRWILLRSR